MTYKSYLGTVVKYLLILLASFVIFQFTVTSTIYADTIIGVDDWEDTNEGRYLDEEYFYQTNTGHRLDKTMHLSIGNIMVQYDRNSNVLQCYCAGMYEQPKISSFQVYGFRRLMKSYP